MKKTNLILELKRLIDELNELREDVIYGYTINGEHFSLLTIKKVLTPFANLDLKPGGLDEKNDDFIVYARDDTVISVGDIRKARMLIDKIDSIISKGV